RVRAVLAVRRRQHGALRPGHRGRRARARSARPVPVLQVAQARLAAAGRGTGQPVMTTVDSAPRITRIGTYLILGVAFLALLGIGLATFRTAKANHEADRKADQLVATLGLPASAADRIAHVL